MTNNAKTWKRFCLLSGVFQHANEPFLSLHLQKTLSSDERGWRVMDSENYANWHCSYIFIQQFVTDNKDEDLMMEYLPLWKSDETGSTYYNKQAITWAMGGVGLWGFLCWAPSAKRKDQHGVSSGWSSTWFHANTGLSSAQYEQIPIIFGVWPNWQTPIFFWSITFWQVHGKIVFDPLKLLSFFRLTYCSIGPCFSVGVLVKWLQIHHVNWSRVFFSDDLST